jgi:hypothetical protein
MVGNAEYMIDLAIALDFRDSRYAYALFYELQ